MKPSFPDIFCRSQINIFFDISIQDKSIEVQDKSIEAIRIIHRLNKYCHLPETPEIYLIQE